MILFGDSLSSSRRQVLSEDAKQHWTDQYKSSAQICSHAYWYVHVTSHVTIKPTKSRVKGQQHKTSVHPKSCRLCCSVFRRGNCKKASVGLQCEVGLRCRTYFVLCGSVLSVWTEVEEVLSPVSGTNVKVQIVRLRTEDGQRIVGKMKSCFTGTLRHFGEYFNFLLDSIHRSLSNNKNSDRILECFL